MMARRCLSAAWVIAACAALSGCGQRGDLYLPTPPKTAVPADSSGPKDCAQRGDNPATAGSTGAAGGGTGSAGGSGGSTGSGSNSAANCTPRN